MRRHHLLALLLLGVSGCHLPLSAGPFPDWPADGRYERQVYDTRGGRPLQAELWFDSRTGALSFDLSHSAHVAVFALQPMGAMELIYPGWDVGGRGLRAGWHTVRADSRLYPLGRSGYRTTRYDDAATYIVLIASRRPLRLGSLLSTRVVPWLTHPSATYNPFDATDRLVREIVPDLDRDEWTVAYQAVWPRDDRYYRADTRRYTRVVCPGGVVVSVPDHAYRSGAYRCPSDRARGDGARGDREPLPEITDRLPKRPRPAAGIGDSPPEQARRPRPGVRPPRTTPPERRVERRPEARPVRPERAQPERRPPERVRPETTRPETTRPERARRAPPRTPPDPVRRPAARTVPEKKPARPKKKEESGGSAGAGSGSGG